MGTCQGTTLDGKPCRNPATQGTKYCHHHQPDKRGIPREIYARLENATPKERTEIVLKLIEEHPEGRLELPILNNIPANLVRIDLSPNSLKARLAEWQDGRPPWWDGHHNYLVSAGVGNFQESNLISEVDYRKEIEVRIATAEEAKQFKAQLQRAYLENANLQNAYLSSANLQKVNLTGANLQNAHLIYTNLQNAHLISADLQNAFLISADLQNALLISANLQNALLSSANLQKANLTGANLQNADLRFANLQEADLSGTNLQDAFLWDTNLQNARLTHAKLQGVDFLSCESIANIYLVNAWLEKTRLHHSQLGGAIGEELSRDYTNAKKAYLALKRNFDDLGDYESSTWAYLKERRMEKLEALTKAREARKNRDWRCYAVYSLKFRLDQLTEIVSDYGEGFGRVVIWILIFLGVIGPVTFWTFGEFEWLKSGNSVEFNRSLSDWSYTTYTYIQLLLYTMDTFTTANFAEWSAASLTTRFVSGCLAMIGIFLVGLLGFVAGNKIRRS